jgi:tetratricopeptide (TPR) repeat protein
LRIPEAAARVRRPPVDPLVARVTAMSLDAFIATAWNDHGDHPEEVADRLAGALDLLVSPADIPPFARIVTHVYGEHLAQWSAGVALLESLRSRAQSGGDPGVAGAITRSVAALRYAGNLDTSLTHLSLDDRIAALATAASALAAQLGWKRAIATYEEALRLAEPGLPSGSPALRALAVTGNNMAASLEEKPDRDPVETRGMVVAAEGGLRYWRLAGTWLEEERAEYRLARSLLQAGDPAAAAGHARRCIDICATNDAPPFERFFGYAALAIAHTRGGGDSAAHATARQLALDQYALVAPDEKQWCEAELNELGR